MSDEISVGQQLLAMGLRQGAWISASILEAGNSRAWADYRSDPRLRERPIKDTALLVVVSQDCDIACRDDNHDPNIELAVFDRINPKKMHHGNQFAHSVRKLQLEIGEYCYEAKVRETVRVRKDELQCCLRDDSISKLSDDQCRTLVLWRANRYQRTALPDRFNNLIGPLLSDLLPELERLAEDPLDRSRSYLRSLYVYLDHLEESGECMFSLMALLRADTPDGIQSEIDDAIEELCQRLEECEASFKLSEEDWLAGFAERDSAITVATLGQYLKFSLEYLSLRQGDPDTGA